MKQKVRKAIIPAAGLGTRFLPATKALANSFSSSANNNFITNHPFSNFLTNYIILNLKILKFKISKNKKLK